MLLKLNSYLRLLIETIFSTIYKRSGDTSHDFTIINLTMVINYFFGLKMKDLSIALNIINIILNGWV